MKCSACSRIRTETKSGNVAVTRALSAGSLLGNYLPCVKENWNTEERNLLLDDGVQQVDENQAVKPLQLYPPGVLVHLISTSHGRDSEWRAFVLPQTSEQVTTIQLSTKMMTHHFPNVVQDAIKQIAHAEIEV
jgi:hypothetical protein